MASVDEFALIDTNVFVYLYDKSEPVKREIARRLVARLGARGTGVLSAQVLSEFYVRATRGPAPLLTREQATVRVVRIARLWRVVPVTADVVIEAIRGVQRFQMSYWDALIWAAARLNGVRTVVSEDGNPGAVLDGVRFVNPFASDISLADLERQT